MFEDLKKSFNVDGEGLAAIAESGMLAKILEDFENYELFIRDRAKRLNSKKFVKKLSNGTNVIYGSNQVPELKKIFLYSHLAACCELFDGWELPVHAINRQGMHALISQGLSQFSDAPADKLNELQARVHRTDVVRSMQILRMMGLLSSNSSTQRQLSFAAGNANRELDGIHMNPVIRRKVNILDNSNNMIVFGKSINRPENVVLIDNDPAFDELYTSFNRNYSEWILALNENADSAMKKIPGLMNKKNWRPCNLVAGIRIDHEIIPDVVKYFTQLAPVLDTVSDFVISIGAGHSLKEFEGRINLMAALFEYLTKQGLEPVRIILHGSGNIEEQRNSPLFGCGPTTTYEILYCKIKTKKLV
ncbi:MAG: hypothetical protein OQL06_11260 [Gammaproteobacteria bacterium]|nr:hypothetical protein [Gammaproteobacteria bacterium]